MLDRSVPFAGLRDSTTFIKIYSNIYLKLQLTIFVVAAVVFRVHNVLTTRNTALDFVDICYLSIVLSFPMDIPEFCLKMSVLCQ